MGVIQGSPVYHVNRREAFTGTDKMIRKKDDPPGGTTGRVGCGTGWMRRPCRTQIHNQSVFERSMPSDLIRGPAPDVIRGPAPDLIRGGYLFPSPTPSQ